MGRQPYSNRAQVGIGTLIIFIAMVLVAAVAAAVLIQTSGVLQQKAEIVKILGYDGSAPGGEITKLAIMVAPSSGTQSIDMNEVVLTLSNGTGVRDFAYDSNLFVNKTNATAGNFDIFSTTTSGDYIVSAAGDKLYPKDDASVDTYGSKFGIVVLKDADNSTTSSTPTLNEGDKVILTINLATNGMNLSTRTTVTGTIKPEYGAPAVISFVTPTAYVDKVMELQG